MANYRNIKGFTVQSASTDPVPYSGAWASGGSLNQSRYSLAGAGTQTAGLAFGGYSAPSRRNETEEYNGTSWSEQNELNTARNELTGAGTQTAALAAGGYLTAALNAVELYDGSSWTETTELNTARYMNASAGTTTSGITMGGDANPPRSVLTELWNGSSWTESGDLSVATSRQGASGVSSTAALSFGGETGPSPNYTAVTESFNGSSWTTGNSMSTSRYALTGTGGAAPNAVALAAGGYSTSSSGMANTEEWAFPSGPSFLIEGQMWYNSTTSLLKGFARDVAEGTWASGTNMNNANAAVGSFGISTAAIEFGGYYPPGSTPGRITTEEYNGTTWTEKSDMSNYRAERPGAGTTAAGLAIRGNPGDATAVEAWGGSSWTAANGTNTPNGGNSASGTQTAAITFGGETTANTELYDGTSWTEVNNMNTARGKMSGSGVQSSAVGSGGTPGPQVLAETWDGSTWSEVTENNTPRSGGAAGGTSNSSSLAFGGGPSRTANTEYWNGSSWTEVANLSTATQDMNYGNVGTTGGTLAIGGDASPPVSTRTEAWTATDAVTTITTSQLTFFQKGI